MNATETAWLTNAVQLGFVVGALLSATLTIADVIRPRTLFAGSADATATTLIAGVVFGRSLVVLAPFVLVWGFVVVADSAQFSAAVPCLKERTVHAGLSNASDVCVCDNDHIV